MFNYEKLVGKVVEAMRPHMTGKYVSQARRRERAARAVADAVIAELCGMAPKESLLEFFIGFTPGPVRTASCNYDAVYLVVVGDRDGKLQYALNGFGVGHSTGVVAHKLLPPPSGGE